MSTRETFKNLLLTRGYTPETEESNMFEKTFVESEVDYIDFVTTKNGISETIYCADIPEELAEGNFWFEFVDGEDNQRWGNLTPATYVIEVVGKKLYNIKFKAVKRYLVENIEEYFETQIPLDKKNPRGGYILGYAIPVEELVQLKLATEVATLK